MHSSKDGSLPPDRRLPLARIAGVLLSLSLLAISASQAGRIWGVKCTSCESVAGRGIVALAGCVFYAAVLVALSVRWPARSFVWPAYLPASRPMQLLSRSASQKVITSRATREC